MAGGQQTFVAGNVLTAAQVNAYLMDQSLLRCTFAQLPTAAAQGGGLLEGMSAYCTDLNAIVSYDGTDWVQITSESDSVTASQTTTSTSYTNLATSGPAVTVLTGTQALVSLYCTWFNAGSNSQVFMSFAVSGATTLAADDLRASQFQVLGTSGPQVSQSRTFRVSGLTAGSNTFTAKYRTTVGTADIKLRDITVVGLL